METECNRGLPLSPRRGNPNSVNFAQAASNGERRNRCTYVGYRTVEIRGCRQRDAAPAALTSIIFRRVQ